MRTETDRLAAINWYEPEVHRDFRTEKSRSESAIQLCARDGCFVFPACLFREIGMT